MLQILAYLLGFEGIFIFTLVMITVLIVGVLVENHKYNKWYDQYYNNKKK
jgi:hypothetical protein